MLEKLKIVAIQAEYSQNICQNLEKATRIISKYGAEADLIIFPELFSSGYFMDEEYLKENSESSQGCYVKSICSLAFKYGVFIVMPFLEREEEAIYNSVVVIDNYGKVIGIKRKSINWKAESSVPHTEMEIRPKFCIITLCFQCL